MKPEIRIDEFLALLDWSGVRTERYTGMISGTGERGGVKAKDWPKYEEEHTVSFCSKSDKGHSLV